MTFDPTSAFLSGGVKGHMRTFCEGEPGNEGTKTGSSYLNSSVPEYLYPSNIATGTVLYIMSYYHVIVSRRCTRDVQEMEESQN